MDELLNLCVELLRWAAPLVGVTYKEINIWLFAIIQPGLIVLCELPRLVAGMGFEPTTFRL